MDALSPKNPLPAQELANHEMADVLISPVTQMACNARDEGDIEDASVGFVSSHHPPTPSKTGKGGLTPGY